MRKLTMLGLFTIMIMAVGIGMIFAQDDEANDEAEAAPRAWLGVMIAQVDEGVIVNRVIPGSPANAAAVLLGDVITALNGEAVESPQDLAAMVQAAAPGDEVRLTLIRNGSQMTVNVTLIAVPPVIAGRPMAPGLGEFDDEFGFLPGILPGMGMGGRGLVPGMNPGMGGRNFDFEFGLPHEGLMLFQAVLGAQLQATDEGYEVLRVMPRAVSGLQAGDLVTAINGTAISELNWIDFLRDFAMQETPTLTLTVIRDGEEITLEAETSLQMRRDFRFGRPGANLNPANPDNASSAGAGFNA